jgi:3-methyl-2-oxobutanoate hydroxymethyltransferase
MNDRVTIHTLREMKQRGEPIAMLTAYDYPIAALLDQAGIDMILVGDTLGMVVHGFETTLPVTMDMMVLHCQAVTRGAKRPLIVADMPFMSYQTSVEDALRNAARLLAEGGTDAVKVEGGQTIAPTVRALVDAGIAVMGHIGLTPQSVSVFGGFKTQGKSIDAARKLVADAHAIEEAGAFALVIEAIPARLAALITDRLGIPTIGIGAGAGCDGQVLVTHDLLGLFDRFTPRFVKKYANLSATLRDAFTAYCADVRAGEFPGKDHEFSFSDELWSEIADEFAPLQTAKDAEGAKEKQKGV